MSSPAFAPVPLKAIRSRSNPEVKALVKLAGSSRERRRTGTTLLEGERLLRAYAQSGARAETVLASESALIDAEVRAFVERFPAGHHLALADGVFGAISQLASAAGVAAVIRTPEPGPVPQLLPGSILLENIQDPGNLGSILRTAVAAGTRQIFLSRSSVFAWSPKVVRAGMGAHFFLSIHEGVDLAGIARSFSGRIIATSPRAATSLYDVDLRGDVAWLFGNEGAGLSSEAKGMATTEARIPMPGQAESMNVAAAAAICLFEQVRQRASK